MEGKKKGYYFGNALKHALTKGIKDYCVDTDERLTFLSENEYLFTGVMLTGMFSYLESTLGSGWIERHGGRHKRDLECLRIIRNAFVHSNSNIEALNSTNAEDIANLRAYIEDVDQGNVKDDKGNIFPSYLTITDDNFVYLKSKSYDILNGFIKAISH